MRMEHYRTPAAFRERIDALAEQAVEGLDNAPKLIAFPEAIALPLAFVLAGVSESETVAGAAWAAVRNHPGRLARVALSLRRLGPSLLFSMTAAEVHAIYVDAFSSAARATGATIVAGSAFLPYVDREPAGGTFIADARVRNVAYTFAPEGVMLARTPKRFLMPRERGAGLVAGAPESLRPIATDAGTVGVAICLDAFHDGVIERYDGWGARILVQPSANHAPWLRPWPADPQRTEGDAWLRYGLRAQLQGRRSLTVGVNPMLVGSVLDLQPRGRSSIVVNAALLPGFETEGWEGVAALAPHSDREAFVRATFDLEAIT